MSEILTTLSVNIYFRYFLCPLGSSLCEHYCFVSVSLQKNTFFYKTGHHVAYIFFLSSLCEHYCFASVCSQKIRFFCKSGHHVAYFSFSSSLCAYFSFSSSLCAYYCFVSISSQKIRVFFIKLATMSHFPLSLSNYAENFSFGISQNSLECVILLQK